MRVLKGGVEVPGWVAPEGQKRSDLELGDWVEFDMKLEGCQSGGFEGSPFWRGWQRVPMGAWFHGVIVGWRTIYSGRFLPMPRRASSVFNPDPPESEPGVRERDVNHRAYLVAFHMRKKPVLVLSVGTDDLRKIER